MKFSKKNLNELLKFKMENEKHIDKSKDWEDGYKDAIKELDFIINVVWED